MLSSWNSARRAISKTFVASSRASRAGTRARSPKNWRSFSTSGSDSLLGSSSFLRLLAIGAFGTGVLATTYTMNREEMVAKAETEETPRAASVPPVITNLTKDSAYIVGSSVMPGKLDDDAMLVPHQILLKGKIKSVAIGEDESWAIDANGKLHSWTQNQSVSIFNSLKSYAFKHVACGANGFMALLQTNGSVWIRFSKDSPFTLINKGDLKRKTVQKLAVGSNHVAVLTTDGQLYTLGSNARGQCGIVELNQSPQDNPHLIPNSAKFVDIDTGCHHTVAVTQDGQVIAFGYNKNLQLGKPQEWVQYSPPAVPMVPFGSYNEVRNSEQQRFSAKNWNDTTEYVTQYAHSLPASVEYFTKQGIKASRVVCGDDFTMIIDKAGKLHGFGDGGRGQLARNPPRSHTKPTHIYREPFSVEDPAHISILSCGSSHCMAMLKNGEIWSWGANANGECAKQNRVFSPVPTLVPVQSPSPVENIICSKNASVFIL